MRAGMRQHSFQEHFAPIILVSIIISQDHFIVSLNLRSRYQLHAIACWSIIHLLSSCIIMFQQGASKNSGRILSLIHRRSLRLAPIPFVARPGIVLQGRGAPLAVVANHRIFGPSKQQQQTRGFSTSTHAQSHPDDAIVARRSGVRNVAIVAHVDHGKTTLVDELLKATTGDKSGGDRLLDSGALEIERGITIKSKVTRMDFDNYICNVVDTPGHADFAGEVDRILSMVDGVCLVVDASEGPMAQTKYVLSRALNLGLQPIVVLNKADRPDAAAKMESGETESQLLDLFDTLGASEEQMDYVTLYASAREGWISEDMQEALRLGKTGKTSDDHGMKTLLRAILKHIPEPTVYSYESQVEQGVSLDGGAYAQDKFSMAATSVGRDQYLGRTCTGRIYSGAVKIGDSLTILRRDPTDTSVFSPQDVTGLFVNRGISRTELEPGFVAAAGDIVTIAGVPDSIAVGDTITTAKNPVSIPIITPPLAPPTLSMDFGANNGPLAGQEGTILTSSKVRERLEQETDNNVTIVVQRSETDSDKMTVFARGELQLGILIEEMRREGFELVVSPPRIVTKICPETGEKLEPYEEVTVDVDAEHAGTVVNALTGSRKGVLLDMKENPNDGKTRLLFDVPSRGLLGFGPEIATLTRGSAIVNHTFLEDRVFAGTLGDGAEKGKMVSNDQGKATLYALNSLSERGTLFVAPGDMVFAGMVIGESSRPGDIEVNPIKAKAVNNMRAAGKEERMVLPPPKKYRVEELIGYMDEDEVIEVTPKDVRLRKYELDAGARERAARSKKKQLLAMKENKLKAGGGGKK